jgi:hypothetical protein
LTDDGHPVPSIRPYEGRDKAQIKAFVCVQPWQRWRLVAQEIIQESPEECENGDAEILVAVEGQAVLGVIVFRKDSQVPNTWESCSLGVLIPRQRQGIGEGLKIAAIEEVVSRDGVLDFISTVNKRNEAMLALNDKLGAETRDDPLDSKHVLTLLKAAPPNSEGDINHF